MSPRHYLHPDGRTIEVVQGFDFFFAGWKTGNSNHRLRSNLTPPRLTADEAQRDLDAYAKRAKWQELPA